MRWVRFSIYNIVILGLIYLIRIILMAFFGLFMADPVILSTILAVVIVFGLSIWYLDWNMKR